MVLDVLVCYGVPKLAIEKTTSEVNTAALTIDRQINQIKVISPLSQAFDILHCLY